MQNQQEPELEPLLVFKQGIDILKKQQISKKLIKFQEKRSIVKICDGQWGESQVGQALQYLETLNTNDMLFLTKNKDSLILKQLSGVKFPHIRQIYLAHNQIISIEPLSYMYAPHLQVIWIQNNLISSLKSLRHAFFPELKYLRVSENFLIDSSQIYMMQINFPVSLFLEQNRFGTTQYQDLNNVAKLKNPAEPDQKFVYIYGGNRIFQDSLINCLKKKLSNLICGFQPKIF